MVRRTLAALFLAALVACHAPSWSDFVAHDAAHDSDMSEGTGSSTTLGEPTPDADESTTSNATSTSAATGELPEETTDVSTSPDSTGEPLLQPRILSIDMPPTIHLAGPVDVVVTAEDTTLVRAKLDGVELDEFADQGGGVFAGTVPIFGSVDNGAHVLEVIAATGSLADLRPVSFEVAAPPAGDQAWAVQYPTGSASRRVIVTPEGDAIEVGAVDVDGAPRPSIRKRAAKDGAEVWPEGTIILDNREGSVDAAALTPDGRIWVAMNVRQANSKWRPRILLLDAEGHETGVEMPMEPGATVRGIAADAAGGFFAVGFAGSGFGDMDAALWRMNGEHVAVFSAKLWDYRPAENENLKHSYSDFAFDVVLKGGTAWVAGASAGYHDKQNPETRGLLAPMDLETGVPLDPVSVQAASGGWRQGMYFGAAAHPDGIAVAGYGATLDGMAQRIELAIYDATGSRVWFQPEAINDVAYATAVAVSAHGGVVVSGVVQDGGVPRGVLLGRKGLVFDYAFPANGSPSAATDLALDAWDQVVVVGEVTSAGVRHARAAFVRQ